MELGDAARSAVESLLGRKVADEEHVTVMAYPAQTPESEPDRKAAVRELIEDLDSMAASASHIPEKEMDQLIDEAVVLQRTTVACRERAAIDAEFALMGTDPDYQAETARIMRDFDGINGHG
jgi:hypothetical protein